ncbi:MAG TPA: CbiQ family ECF transporter T component, partial [Desulfosarcina sp.]|nr:CbiQ family ECF transporter T component [Desulfosarcina sp.]
MGDLTAIGFTPGRSPCHRLDPRTKQALLLGFSSLSLWGDVVYLGLLSVAALFCLHLAGVRLGRLICEIRFFLYFLLIVFCTRTIDFKDGWVPGMDPDAVAGALMFVWRLLTVVLMGLLVTATTPTAGIRAALA